MDYLDIDPGNKFVWLIVAVSVLAAALYGFVFLDKPPSPLRAAVKTLLMAPLAVLVSISGSLPLLLAGVIASALGDCLLAFDKKWTLPLGILSFLIAQVSYAALFVEAFQFTEPTWPRYAAIALIAATAIGFLIWLWPKLGALAFGVVPYSAAIAAMAISAMGLGWAGWPVMLGALSFMVSDGVLSAELFKLAPDASQRRLTAPVVWWTYVAAQLLIVLGVMFTGAGLIS